MIGVRPEAAERVLAALRAHPLGRDAAIVGTCDRRARRLGHPRHRLRPAAARRARGRAAAAHLLSGQWRPVGRAHPHGPRRRGRHHHHRPPRSASTRSTWRPRRTCARPACSMRATRRSAPSCCAAPAASSAAAPISSTSAPAARRRISAICSPGRAVARTGYGAVFKQILEYLHSTISEIRRAPKPFIAAVDGIAAAGGFGIAMACDLVFASERASFEWAYGKTGLTGAESSTFFLPRLIGLRRAWSWCSSTRASTPARRWRWAWSTRCIPTERFDAGGAFTWHGGSPTAPTRGVRRRQGPDQPGRRGRSARLPPRPGAGEPGAHRRRRRLRRGHRRLLRQAAGALSRIVSHARVLDRPGPARPRRGRGAGTRGDGRAAHPRPHRRARRRRARAPGHRLLAVARAHGLPGRRARDRLGQARWACPRCARLDRARRGSCAARVRRPGAAGERRRDRARPNRPWRCRDVSDLRLRRSRDRLRRRA